MLVRVNWNPSLNISRDGFAIRPGVQYFRPGYNIQRSLADLEAGFGNFSRGAEYLEAGLENLEPGYENFEPSVTGLLICCGITRHNVNLARSLFFITQNSRGTATAHRSLLGSPAQSPSHPPSLTCTVPHVLPSWRLPVSGPPSTSGYPRDVTCPATLLCMQPYVSHVSSATRSVTSPSRFPQSLLRTNIISDGLAPSSRSLRLGCTLRGFCSLRRRPCHPTALLCSSPQDISDMMYSRPVQKSKWCVYAVTACMCCKEGTY